MSSDHHFNLGRTEFGDPANSGNLMSLEDAHQLLGEWVTMKDCNHMKQVER
jgi:hypothetical protein